MEQTLQGYNQKNRLELWTERVSACRQSGKSVRDWCRENGISEKTYYYWQRRIFQACQTEAPTFAEVTIPESRHEPAAVLRYGDLSIEIQNSADSETIHAIIAAVRSC